ncbi:hypothetical protein M3Y98_00637800 [Aphelenchoides besseyi]|nr:hypothetical protein M3Y98_00637800 [Aphelenchoides besseyi]KAI6208539.1 hypothetical protein M3Y96_00125900 [Aphelenchoides besseyi]
MDKIRDLLPPDPRDNSPPPSGNFIARAFDSFLRFFRHIQQKPIHVQIGVGAGCGFFTSYFCTRLSKFFAMVMGCSFIVIQFLNYRGYLKFNRSQLQQDIDDLSEKIRSQIGVPKKTLPSNREMDDFLAKNGYLFSGFIGGSLIGYGLA